MTYEITTGVSYPAVSIENAGDEVNRLNKTIEIKAQSAIQDAIRIGEILTSVKENVQHGEFIPWVAKNCKFSQSTAQKYISLWENKEQIGNSHANTNFQTPKTLQEAYSLIETLEAQAKRTEGQKAQDRIETYNKTGKKPEGWRQHTDDKLAQEKREQDERVKLLQKKIQEESKSREQIADMNDRYIDEGLKAAQDMVENITKRQSFKESIRVSHEGLSDPFVDAIMDYLDTLHDDNRRIEACYNIIKVCKGIAVAIQTKKASA